MEVAMPNENSHYSPVFRIDVSADPANAPAVQGDTGLAMVTLMRQMIALQERQNQMLEQLVQQASRVKRPELWNCSSGKKPIHAFPELAGLRLKL